MVVFRKEYTHAQSSRLAVRVGCTRCPVTGIPDEWSSNASNRMDKTRLTGRLAFLIDVMFLNV